MAKTPPKLTETQKDELAKLEPALRQAVRRRDYEVAKSLTTRIQTILRPTGHETRLMQAKNWLFEAAMEAGLLQVAIAGFSGIRQKVNARTRVYLEATALLAICHIRQRDLRRAEPLIAEVLTNTSVIQSEHRQRQFRLRIIGRFEQEGVLASLEGQGSDELIPEEIEAQVAIDVQTKTEDEILADLGAALPSTTVAFLLRIDEIARKKLPSGDLKYLPPPQDLVKKSELGRSVQASFSRVLWQSLCDRDSEIYKAWYANGISVVLSKKYLTGCVITALSGYGIGITGLAVSAIALFVKFGLEVWCDRFRPVGVMIGRDE